MGTRVLAVGLDGADWAVAGPLMRRGELPALSELRARGAFAVLESTVPPVTFPAWSTFLTGVGPGRHGLLDFTRWEPGRYRVRFVSGAARRVPTLLERLDAAGLRVASLSVPGTWPPPRLARGFVLAGFDAPVALGPGPDHAHPRSLYARLARAHGPWVYADVDELRVRPGWHRAARRRLIEGLARKARFAGALLEERDWDLFLVHLGETDTAGHHFMAFHDPDSPRRPPRVHPEEASAVADVYRAADRVLARLLEAAGPDAAVLVASDHGMVAASDRTLHLARALAAGGFLSFREAPSPMDRALGAARDRALRHLPGRLKEALFRRGGSWPSRLETRRRLGDVDLARSLAFSEELTYFPSVRLNVRGREPLGLVAPEDVPAVRRAITEHLLALRDPEGGGPVVAEVTPRERAVPGPACPEAPDLLITPAAPSGHPYTVLPSRGSGAPVGRLRGAARLGGKARGPTGVHRPEGILVLAGAPLAGDLGRVPIAACAGTLLRLCGLEPPADLDHPGLLPGAPAGAADGAAPAWPGAGAGYTPEEEARVAERLRALGYLE